MLNWFQSLFRAEGLLHQDEDTEPLLGLRGEDSASTHAENWTAMTDKGFTGNGEGKSEVGARNVAAVTQVCKSSVLSCASLERASLCRISEEAKEALLWDVINSQRVFNEQVRRAVTEAQSKCPGTGTCQGRIKLENLVSNSSSDEEPLDISTNIKHDSLSNTLTYDQKTLESRNGDLQEHSNVSFIAEQQQNSNSASPSVDKKLLNSSGDEDKSLSDTAVLDGGIEKGVDLSRYGHEEDDSTSVESRETPYSVGNTAMGIPQKDEFNQLKHNLSSIDDASDHKYEISHKDAIVQCIFDDIAQASVEVSDSMTQTESCYLVDEDPEKSRASQEVAENTRHLWELGDLEGPSDGGDSTSVAQEDFDSTVIFKANGSLIENMSVGVTETDNLQASNITARKRKTDSEFRDRVLNFKEESANFCKREDQTSKNEEEDYITFENGRIPTDKDTKLIINEGKLNEPRDKHDFAGDISDELNPTSSTSQCRLDTNSLATEPDEKDNAGFAELDILAEDRSSFQHESSTGSDSLPAQSEPRQASPKPESCVSPFPCCSHMSCLYNQPGKLCTVLGKQFIFTSIKDAPVLIELKLEMVHNHPCGCSLLWRGKHPVPLASLEDGTQVYFDAVVFTDSSKFTCLVVWQGEKPKISVEPYFASCVYLCEEKGINGILSSFEKGMGYVRADINGEVEMLMFPPSVFFINGKKIGKKAEILDLIANKDLKVCMDLVKFATAGKCLLLCSRVWKGKQPSDKNLQIAPKPFTLYKNVQGDFIKHKKQVHLYIDVEASVIMTDDECSLKFKMDGNEIFLPWVDKIMHSNNKKVDVDLSVKRVKAHILRWQSNTNMTAYRFLLVQEFTESNGTLHLETSSQKGKTKITESAVDETQNVEKAETSLLTLAKVSEVNAQVNLDSTESYLSRHSSAKVGQMEDLSMVSYNCETDCMKEKILLNENKLKEKGEEKTNMTENRETLSQSLTTETDKIPENVPSMTELIFENPNVEREESVKEKITGFANTKQLGLCNEEALLTKSEIVVSSPKNEGEELEINDEGESLSTDFEVQSVPVRETLVTQQEAKASTFQSTLLKIKSKKSKPSLLMNHPGTLVWDNSRSVFVISTRIPFGDIKFSVGGRACCIFKGNFTIPEKSADPIPVMFDAFLIGLSSYRLLALWRDVKPPAARTGTSYYCYEVPGAILRIVDNVIDLHVYLEKGKCTLISSAVPQKVFSSEGDIFTSSLSESFLIRVHLKVPLNSGEGTDCQILLMIVMVRDGKPLRVKDFLTGKKSSDLTCVFDNEKLSGTQALLHHLSTMKDKKCSKAEDLPDYLKNFTGIIVEREGIGKVILCHLPRGTVFIHFSGYVFVDGHAIEGSRIPCKTVVQFDAFIKKNGDMSKYVAVFVWTGRKIDQVELEDGSRYFFYLSGRYLGNRDRSICEYELELDGEMYSYACQKTGNVILPNGKIGAYPPPGSRVSIHLKRKKCDGPGEGVTLFVFVSNKSMEPNSSHSTCSKENQVCESERQLQGDPESEYTFVIYNCSGELVTVEDGSKALKVAIKRKFLLKLDKKQRVFIDKQEKSIANLKDGSVISFDAVQQHSEMDLCYRAVLLWTGCKPSYYEQSAEVHYAYDVEGVLLSANKKGLHIQMKLQGQVVAQKVDKTGMMYFDNGRRVKTDLQKGDSLILHLKIKKEGTKIKMIPLLMIVTSDHPNRLESIPQAEKKKLKISIKDQVMGLPKASMLFKSQIRDPDGNDKNLGKEEEASSLPTSYSIFEGCLEKMGNGTYQFICQYEHEEKCIALPLNFPLEQSVKQNHVPFYMIVRISRTSEVEKYSLRPICGWFKKTTHGVFIAHNLEFHSMNFAEKLIGLRDIANDSYSCYSLESPFIYMGKSYLTLHEFTHSPIPKLHAIVEEIPSTDIAGEHVTKHILFLTSNAMLSKTALRFLAFSEIDHEFEQRCAHITDESDFIYQSDEENLEENSHLLQAREIVHSSSQEKKTIQIDALKGDELRARIKDIEGLQNYLILEGTAVKNGLDKFLFTTTYEGNRQELIIPVESFRMENDLEMVKNNCCLLTYQNSIGEVVMQPILGWCGRTKREAYVLTNQEVMSFNIEYGFIGLASQCEEFYQMYSVDQYFFLSDTGERLPFKELLPLHGKYKTVNVVVEDTEVRKVHDHLICKKVLFISRTQCLALVCAKMFTQHMEEMPFSQIGDTAADTDKKLTYKDMRIQPKNASQITYGMFNACSVMDTCMVLHSKTRKVIVSQGDLYCDDEKVKSHLPLQKVLRAGRSVAAFATEMKEPINIEGILISEVAVIAFIGKKPKQSEKIIAEWKCFPEKIIRLPGRKEGNSFIVSINVSEKFMLTGKELGDNPPPAVKDEANGKTQVEDIKKQTKLLVPSTPKKKKTVPPAEGSLAKKSATDNVREIIC